MLLVFPIFLTLIIATFWGQAGWERLRLRSVQDWLLDLIGLAMQGFVIPMLQVLAIGRLYQMLIPSWQGVVHLGAIGAFLLNVVGVDYLYYWNHRWLHQRQLWPVHQVHHSVTEMDVLGTSRNTLWSSLLIVYLWVNGLFVYLLDDPKWYLLGMSVTSGLDLWRHSRFSVGLGLRWLSPWLMLPQDHHWHHAQGVTGCNFGANFKLWDRWHGTAWQSDAAPEVLGADPNLPVLRQLLFPFA
jgi:sterol desaturase/sphingolipid hydroxylase (fatty acid hydroxylase superfamily)